jgi:signal transduction histidine kinase
MLCLRERIDPNRGIIPILEGMLLRFERNWSIKTTLLTDHNASTNHKVFLSPQAEIQLIRIVQEALMNIRRHAQARTVTIKVCKDMDSLVVTIMDDGIGFRLEDIPQESLGLRIMHERASCVGATVQIDSVEGTGTILRIQLPGYEGAPI